MAHPRSSADITAQAGPAQEYYEKDAGSSSDVSKDLAIPRTREEETQDADAQSNLGLRRGLKSRHLSMMAIGGVIGPGFFMSIGIGFVNGGPAGIILGFSLVGILLWFVMQSLGEVAAFLSVTGSFTNYSARFLDPAIAFALGWSYIVLWASVLTSEYNTLSLICTFWESKMPSWGFILVGNVFFLAFSCISVKGYGEAEYFLTWIKLLFLLAFFICSILITSGAIGNVGPVGFKFWKDPGAFSDGVAGVFKNLAFAAMFYSGTEMIGMTAGEAKKPARDIPRAVKLVFYRIAVVYVGSLFFLSLVIAWDDPRMLSGSSKTARSPFVLAFTNVGYAQAGNVLNAIILATVFSAVNGALYVSSRNLIAMADAGYAPGIFKRTNRFGAPWVALMFVNALGLLSLLNQSAGAGKVYVWLTTIGGVCAFITWACISACHVRFRKALSLQGISEDELPYSAPLFPYGAWFGLVLALIFIFFQGWTAFLPPFEVQNLFMNYIMVPVFLVLYGGYKVYCKTQWVNLATADLQTGRRTFVEGDEEEQESVAKRVWVSLTG